MNLKLDAWSFVNDRITSSPEFVDIVWFSCQKHCSLRVELDDSFVHITVEKIPHSTLSLKGDILTFFRDHELLTRAGTFLPLLMQLGEIVLPHQSMLLSGGSHSSPLQFIVRSAFFHLSLGRPYDVEMIGNGCEYFSLKYFDLLAELFGEPLHDISLNMMVDNLHLNTMKFEDPLLEALVNGCYENSRDQRFRTCFNLEVEGLLSLQSKISNNH